MVGGVIITILIGVITITIIITNIPANRAKRVNCEGDCVEMTDNRTIAMVKGDIG
jgi:hypothetical protein